MKKILTLVVGGMLLLTGCLSGVHYKYDEENSLALNYAQAGGINTGIKDAEVPKDTVDKINNSLASGAFEGTLGYLTAGTLNLSGLTGSVLGLISGLFEAPHAAERTAMFAYMPSHEAENAEAAVKKNA